MAVEPLAGEGEVPRDGRGEVEGPAAGGSRQIADLDRAGLIEGLGTWGLAEGVDEVLADFFPQAVGPSGTRLYRRSPRGWLGGLIERLRLELEAEDAAEGFEGVQSGQGAAAHVADGVGAAGGEQGEAAVGEAGVVDEGEEALPEVHG